MDGICWILACALMCVSLSYCCVRNKTMLAPASGPSSRVSYTGQDGQQTFSVSALLRRQAHPYVEAPVMQYVYHPHSATYTHQATHNGQVCLSFQGPGGPYSPSSPQTMQFANLHQCVPAQSSPAFMAHPQCYRPQAPVCIHTPSQAVAPPQDVFNFSPTVVRHPSEDHSAPPFHSVYHHQQPYLVPVMPAVVYQHPNAQQWGEGFPRRVRTRARSSFSHQQVIELEEIFKSQKYLNQPDRVTVACRIGLTDQQIKIWFQNRRYKTKKESCISEGRTTPDAQDER